MSFTTTHYYPKYKVQTKDNCSTSTWRIPLSEHEIFSGVNGYMDITMNFNIVNTFGFFMFPTLNTHLSVPGPRLLFHLKVFHFHPGDLADWAL